MKGVCPKCFNCDKNYFFYLNDKMYCRKCMTYVKEEVSKNYNVKSGTYNLSYSLTKRQKEASDFILDNITRGKDCAINAVCGAGKTEIIYETLQYCLNNNLRVGIAIPRKDVVVELKERIEKNFNVNVEAVYGGHHNNLTSDIIVFTTHQAGRYTNYFNILIIDEVDAFPYNNNETLKGIIKGCSEIFVYLSATMPKYIEKDKGIEKFYLNRRYHGYDLPIPKCIESFNMLFTLKRVLSKYKGKVVLVYFPTIALQNIIAKKIKYNYLINSKTNDREMVLEKIKELNEGVVLTTTVLERGITIKNVQVVVYNADHKLFNKDTLIQISGRVGRDKIYHDGKIIFICKRKNKEIKSTIKNLKKYNE